MTSLKIMSEAIVELSKLYPIMNMCIPRCKLDADSATQILPLRRWDNLLRMARSSTYRPVLGVLRRYGTLFVQFFPFNNNTRRACRDYFFSFVCITFLTVFLTIMKSLIALHSVPNFEIDVTFVQIPFFSDFFYFVGRR